MTNEEQSITSQELLLMIDSIVVYREILDNNPFLALRELLEEVSDPDPNLRVIYRKYHELCAIISNKNWTVEILNLILNADNNFSKAQDIHVISYLKKLVSRDLEILQEIANLDAIDIKSIIIKNLDHKTSAFSQKLANFLKIDNWPEWNNSKTLEPEQEVLNESKSVKWLKTKRKNVINSFINLNNWGLGVNDLLYFYQKVGSGLFGSFVAFRWIGEHDGYLEGIDNPDSIRKDQLIGQAREQGIVVENTEHFINGYPANNVILYGDRGTGKSSLVKALLNEYASEGLRLIELHKANLGDYHLVIRKIKEQPHKFIIFIDDLSFDDSEPEYKALKTLLEGGVEVRPANVLIYSTSNRRHLVKETFSERQGNDVHVRDNQEEKLSLSDRFGITVTFPAPDQQGYLRIVEGLVDQHNLKIDHDELRQQALRWLLTHNGRSGRTARQFVDYLIGTISLAK